MRVAIRRVPEGDGAATRVQLGRVRVELGGPGQRHRGERLVDLVGVEVVDRQARALEDLVSGRDRPRQHDLGVGADDSEAVQPGSRREPELVGLRLAHDQRGRRAIGQRRGVAGRDHPVDLRVVRRELVGPEHRWQCGEPVGGRIRPDGLVHGVPGAVGQLHRNDLSVEGTRGRRLSRATVRLGGEFVELPPCELPPSGDELGADTLVREPGEPLLQGGEGLHAERGRAHRHPAHRLDAARDRDVVRTRDDALRGEMHGLLAAAALPVDGGAGDRHRETGVQQGRAPDVERLVARLADTSRDDVVDESGVEARALDQGGEHRGEQIGGVDPGQRAARLPLPRRGADDVDDDGTGHAGFPFSVVAPARCSSAPRCLLSDR